MKNPIIALLFVLACCTRTNAQVTFGPEAGFNISNYTPTAGGQALHTTDYVNFRGGLILDIPASYRISLQPGLFYAANGFSATDGFSDAEFVYVHTVEVPVNVTFKFGRPTRGRFSIGAGPYFAFNIGGTIKEATSFTQPVSTNLKIGSDSTSDIKGFDVGVGVNIAYHLPFGLFVRVHYEHGAVNLLPNGDAHNSLTYSGYGTTIGFLFDGKHHEKDYSAKYFR